MFGILVFLVAQGWLNNVVFRVVRIIAVYSSVMLMSTGVLCRSASAFSSWLTMRTSQGALHSGNAVLLKSP